VLAFASYLALMAHYDVWRDGLRWRFEAATSTEVVRGWRPTQRLAIRAARGVVHRVVDCSACRRPVYAEARKCWRCGAMLRAATPSGGAERALEPRLLVGPIHPPNGSSRGSTPSPLTARRRPAGWVRSGSQPAV